MYERVHSGLCQVGLEHVVFGSAAGAVYGWTRPPADLDVLVRCPTLAPLRACFPDSVQIAENGLLLGGVELWHAPLVLRFAGRVHTLPFDDELRARCIPHPVFGRVLGPEDQLLIKATLQRNHDGKVDTEDAHRLVRFWGSRLDLAYFARRAAQCGVTDRVALIVPALVA